MNEQMLTALHRGFVWQRIEDEEYWLLGPCSVAIQAVWERSLEELRPYVERGVLLQHDDGATLRLNPALMAQ